MLDVSPASRRRHRGCRAAAGRLREKGRASRRGEAIFPAARSRPGRAGLRRRGVRIPGAADRAIFHPSGEGTEPDRAEIAGDSAGGAQRKRGEAEPHGDDCQRPESPISGDPRSRVGRVARLLAAHAGKAGRRTHREPIHARRQRRDLQRRRPDRQAGAPRPHEIRRSGPRQILRRFLQGHLRRVAETPDREPARARLPAIHRCRRADRRPQ